MWMLSSAFCVSRNPKFQSVLVRKFLCRNGAMPFSANVVGSELGRVYEKTSLVLHEAIR
jgi:hypothetical protein